MLNEILLPLANFVLHPLLFDSLKQHIALFKPEVRFSTQKCETLNNA